MVSKLPFRCYLAFGRSSRILRANSSCHPVRYIYNADFKRLFLPHAAFMWQHLAKHRIMTSNKDRRAIPLLSFFSGAGFLDIGFLRTGKFFIPWHNECHEPFADAYEYGVAQLGYKGSERIQNRNKVENIRYPVILEQAFGTQRPQMFGVIGGPPCPDFSCAGKNHGHKGQNGRLTRRYANIILQLRPTFFLLENVPGLLETKKHRTFLFSVMRKLGGSYAVDLQILNALEYGVPQSRRRVFVVGVCLKWLAKCYPQARRNIAAQSRKIIELDVSKKRSAKEVAADIYSLHWFCWPSPSFPDAEIAYPWGKRNGAPSELLVGHQFSKINGHPNAGDVFRPRSGRFKTVKEGDTSRKSFKRLHRYSYSPNAAYGNNEVHLHPTKPRRISVAEALALQSMPKEYCFPDTMTLTDKFKAVSNGVPVLLAESMAMAFTKFFTGGMK